MRGSRVPFLCFFRPGEDVFKSRDVEESQYGIVERPALLYMPAR
jgi:hypothetical protein